MTNRSLALTTSGDITVCVAPPEKRGQGRCNHVLHQDQGEIGKDFLQRSQKSTDNEISLKRDKEFLDHALEALDQKLNKLSLPEPISIRVIGGYALMHHNLREGGKTFDIDTVTKDYEHRVNEIIREIGDEYILQSDWLNNENVDYNDTENLEKMIKYQWEDSELKFKNIKLSVADLETLTKTKIAAMDVWDNDSHRTQDPHDLIDLINSQDITSYADFRSQYGEFTSDGYQNADKFVKTYLQSGKTHALSVMQDAEAEWEQMMADLDSDDSSEFY